MKCAKWCGGAEAIHDAHMMKLDRVYQSIPDEVERLKYIVKEHILESDPSLTCLRPPPQKRKKKSKSGENTSSSSDSDSDSDA